MMKRFVAFGFSILVAVSVSAQERVDITSFETDEALNLSYSGASIPLSFVDFSPIPPNDVVAQDGDNALVVEYAATAEWNWSQLDFPSVDLTGMREIHMWVYFSEDWTGETDVRVDLAGGVGLGEQGTGGVTGEWVELVWPIDRFTSETLSDVSFFGGFIAPGDGTATGTVYIDNIFANRPANVPEVETITLYGFNEEDPATGQVMGWQDNEGAGLLASDVTPSEGSAYMELALGNGWTNNVQAVDPLGDFDRWQDVVDIQLDARVSEGFTGTWVQYVVVIQVGADDVDAVWNQLPEQGFSDATSEWKRIIWNVDMEQHRPAFEGENTWMNLFIITNNDGAQAGQLVFLDNFRVGAVVEDTPVEQWSLY